jgi:hypothetical protein
MASLLLKYIAREYWNTNALKSNEKATIKQIILEKIVSLNSQIAFHLVIEFTD